jgi:predicted transcriptional regulator
MSMNQTELQTLGKIESRLARLEALQEANVRTTTELTTNVNRLVEKLDRSDEIAREADQRARSAHHRIDETNKRVDGVENDITWLWRTVITAIVTGAIGGAITFILKGIGS